MKRSIVTLVALAIIGLLIYSQRLAFVSGVMEKGLELRLFADRTAELEDGLHLALCGAGGPLPAPKASGPCVAVVAGSRFFIVDVGTDSPRNLGRMGYPVGKVEAVLLTHFHSDHIAEIPTVNLTSWVMGRQGPLKLYGPPGVWRIADGFNEAFALDREYRVTHHGADFMPIEFGRLEAIESPVESTLEFGDLTVTSFKVNHAPIEPAVGYRFDYKGRSVVITGDTVVTDRLRAVVDDADLLFSDAMSLPIVKTLEGAAEASGQDRLAKILHDIQDYHASVADVAELTRTTGVGMTALYHLVPGPRNALMENIFKREFADNMVLTSDRMWFTLPAGSDDVLID